MARLSAIKAKNRPEGDWSDGSPTFASSLATGISISAASLLATVQDYLNSLYASVGGYSNLLIFGGFALLIIGILLARKSHSSGDNSRLAGGDYGMIPASIYPGHAGAQLQTYIGTEAQGIQHRRLTERQSSAETGHAATAEQVLLRRCGRHILSRMHYHALRAVPVPDAVLDFRYPDLERELDLDPVETRGELEFLCDQGFLSRQVEFETLACPSCGATAPISVPEYGMKGAGRKGKEDRRHHRQRKDGAVSYRCVKCSLHYTQAEANSKPAFSYAVKPDALERIVRTVPDFSRFIEALDQFGLKGIELAKIKGSSGITHMFDIAFSREAAAVKGIGALKLGEMRESSTVVDICGSEGKVDPEPVKSFYGELSDLNEVRGMIVAVPGMAAEAENLAHHYGLHLLVSPDFDRAYNEFLFHLRNESSKQSSASSIAFGLEGFDKIAPEFPSKRIYILAGPPGSLKTTIAARYLTHGAEAGENGVMVITSQTIDGLLKDFSQQGLNMELFGRSILLVDLTTQVEDLKARISSGDMGSVRNYILKMITDLGKVVMRHKAKRLVIDSISDFWPENAINKDFIRGFILSLSRMNTTALLTKTTGGEGDSFSYEGSYVDGIINLGLQSVGDARKRFIEVLKMRGVKINPSRFEIDTNFIGEKMEPVILGRLPVPPREESQPLLEEGGADVT